MKTNYFEREREREALQKSYPLISSCGWEEVLQGCPFLSELVSDTDLGAQREAFVGGMSMWPCPPKHPRKPTLNRLRERESQSSVAMGVAVNRVKLVLCFAEGGHLDYEYI